MLIWSSAVTHVLKDYWYWCFSFKREMRIILFVVASRHKTMFSWVRKLSFVFLLWKNPCNVQFKIMCSYNCKFNARKYLAFLFKQWSCYKLIHQMRISCELFHSFVSFIFTLVSIDFFVPRRRVSRELLDLNFFVCEFKQS